MAKGSCPAGSEGCIVTEASQEESIRGLFAIHTIPTAKYDTECPREPGAWGAVPFVEVLSLSRPATAGYLLVPLCPRVSKRPLWTDGQFA